jgi:integrase
MKNEKFPKVVKVGSAVVKIYRGKITVGGRRYETFTVAYHRDGKRQRKVFRKLSDAKEAARDIATKIAQGRANAKELNGSDLESYNAAMNLLRPHGLPLHSVIEEYLAARERLDGESLLSAAKEYARRHRHSDKPVQEVVDQLLATKERDGLSLRYIQSLRGHLKNGFAQAFRTNIGSITASMIDEWLAGLAIGPRARNNIRMSIVTLFQYARAHGYLPKDQRTEAEHVTRAKDRGGKIEILQPRELDKLFKKANAEASLYLALGAFTGVRSAELIRLEWQDVNFNRGHIIVGKEKSKTATRRLVPIQSNLMQWLAPYRGFTGRVFSSEHAADRTIAFAKKHVKWPSNALRHSFATYRLAMTNDAAKVALEMGNSPQMLFRDYRELADEHDAKAWFAIAPEKKQDRKIIHLQKHAAVA